VTFSIALFEPHVGSIFTVSLHSGEQIAFVLDDIQDKTDPGAPYTAFSVFFSADVPLRLPQGAYPMQHPVLQEQFIFLVPIGVEAGRVNYQACFNIDK
jgi:hypothetical protein